MIHLFYYAYNTESNSNTMRRFFVENYIPVLTILFIMVTAGCEEEFVDTRTYPAISTLEVKEITEHGATFAGKVESLNGSEIIEHGFVWGPGKTLTVNWNERAYLGQKNNTGEVTYTLNTTLEPGKEYFVSFFVETDRNMVYGEPRSFVSLGSDGPEILGFKPAETYWSDTVSIMGKGFGYLQGSNSVYLGTVKVPSLALASDTLLRFIVPTSVRAEKNIVSVTLAGNKTIFTDDTLLFHLPQAISASPENIRWGDTITLTMSNLPNKTGIVSVEVYLDQQKMPWVINSAGGVYDFPIPDFVESLSNQVKIRITDFEATFPVPLTLLPPVIDSISPVTGTWSTEVTLYGRFNKTVTGTYVMFGDMAGTIKSVTRDSIKVLVPRDLSALVSQVVYKYKTFSCVSPESFTLSPPVIESVSPADGYAGSIVTISGQNFKQSGTIVRFNSITATNISATPTQIRCYVPGDYAGTAHVSVTVGSQTTVYPDLFNVLNPIVTDFEPESVTPGDTISVYCTNSLNSLSFRFYPPSGTNYLSATEISRNGNDYNLIVPELYYTTSYIGVYFSYNNITSLTKSSEPVAVRMPEIMSVFPVSGSEGTEITMTGANFSLVEEYNRVTVGGVRAEITSCDRNEIKFLVPPLQEGSYDISLSLGGYSCSSPVRFENSSAWSNIGESGINFLYSGVMEFSEEVIVAIIRSEYSKREKWLYRFDSSTETFSYYKFHYYVYLVDNCRTVIKNDIAYQLGISYFGYLYSYNRASNLYTQLSTYPGVTDEGAVFLDGDSVLYAGGGTNAQDFWKYNPAKNRWTRLGDLPGGSSWTNEFTVAGRCFVITTDNRLWEYSPAGDTWIQRSSCPLPYAEGRANLVMNGRAYIGYGRISSTSDYTRQMCYYDHVNDQWHLMGNGLPDDCTWPVVFSRNNLLYFIPGPPASFGNPQIYTLDPSKL